jgi:predicted metal-dependent peptidase
MQDDAQFTKTLAASNKVLTDLRDEIDLEEIETAKALNQEFDMQRGEMNEMLADDEDDDLMDEINQMEAAMQNKNFDEVDGQINTHHKEMHRKQTMAKQQDMMAS